MDLPKIFPRPPKNVIFLATFHKFLQFRLSKSDVSTTFGHFSQKSPLCRCGSYTHGSQRLMVSTEIIKNWGAKWGGAENNLGGGHLPPPLAPPLPPPPGAATDNMVSLLSLNGISFLLSLNDSFLLVSANGILLLLNGI